MKKIIPDGKYKGFEKLDESTDKRIVLKKDNITVTITIDEDGIPAIETKTDIGSKKDYDSIWKW